MCSSLVVSPELAEKAKQAENAALQDFYRKIEPLCGRYTMKEAARIVGISAGRLRDISVEQGFHFLAASERDDADRRRIRKDFAVARQTRTVRKVERPAPVIQPGQLRVTPRQELEGRKLLWQRQNAFYEKVCALSEVLTLKETAERVGVSVRFLKNFAYDWDVDFKDEPRTYSVGKADQISPDSEFFTLDSGDHPVKKRNSAGGEEVTFATLANTWPGPFQSTLKTAPAARDNRVSH
ncbi:hypothetical protein ACSVIJ_04600 [Pseudomonas sp. NCHU5208]|uniref:hypothetical protein n=1 Tax=unclassified Pseudomonas TaxID=196821 RepID=UPI003F9C4E4C